MRQSTILINAALIIVKMVFTLMNERSQSRMESSSKSGKGFLQDSTSGILLSQKQRMLDEPPVDEQKTVTVAGDYAYVNTGSSLIIYNVCNKHNPAKVSETLF